MRVIPPSTADRTVAIASSRVVAPQTCPIPPPPSVRGLTGQSDPNILGWITTDAPRLTEPAVSNPSTAPTRKEAAR